MTAKEEETERGGESNGGGEGETERSLWGNTETMQIRAERTTDSLLYIYCSVTNTKMSPLWLSLLCNINNNLEVYLQLLV